MRNTQASKWRHNVDKDRAATMAEEAMLVGKKAIQLAEVTHLVIRVQVRISLGKGNRWRCKHKAVARRATDMTMVTRLWREPGTKRMTLEWRPGWDLGHWFQMISA